MQNELIKDIGEIIQNNKSNIPKGYKLWEAQGAFDSLEEFLQFLTHFFEKEEEAIKIDRKGSYVTESYENNVRNFAITLAERLIRDHGGLTGMKPYADLLGQKHIAYAFYHLLDTNDTDLHNILKDRKYRRRLYQGLTKFYSEFCGFFADNEEAIRLLCKYYPKADDSWLEAEEVTNALNRHIQKAGTPSDFGYAYNGIEQIHQYIKGLPNRLIPKLLEQYRLYDVVNQKIFRHQMFGIIDGSGLDETDKHTLKFFYLDSLLLANAFNIAWVDRDEVGKKEEVYYNDYDLKLTERRIQVLERPNAYWDNENTEKRLFQIDGQETASISMEEKTIVFKVRGKKDEFPFVYSDWALEDFRIKEFREKIHRLVSGDGSGNLEEKPMTFSLLYLDDYRGIKDRMLDFDHRFTFQPDNLELKRQEREQKPGLHFYGKAVYSLSCIVGKNGTGKTTIVDFLRDTFYKMLRILEDFDIPCENGYITADSICKYKILNEKERFLVVFRLGEEDCFLTNIAGVNSTGALPYQKGSCRNLALCKVVYFSQQLRADQTMLLANGERTGRQEASGIARTLDGLGQCDYSEMKSFRQRRDALAALKERNERKLEEAEPVINRELCYQFSLLRNIDMKEFCKYLDIEPERKFTIYNLKSGEILENFSLEKCKDISELKTLENKYDQMPEAAIGFFSSGQYAKFMFLAKLYWFLEGANKESEYYRDIFGEQFFWKEDARQPEETALIFIDEGELYYHPEWQRRYLSTLLDMMCRCREEAKLQVVFTTNSPFVISDVLKEDVQYLSDKPEEFGNPLGQNIHKLLKNNFFMDYTIGEYSRKLIEAIIRWMRDVKEKSEEEWVDISNYFDRTQDEYGMIGLLIQQIGEPIYRNKLEKMLEELKGSRRIPKETRIRELERQKVDLEKEIAQLKGEEYDRNREL